MAEPISDPALVSQLCVDCGLCCNGAIFDHAGMEDGEAEFVESIGMEIIRLADGKQAIGLPCPHLCGTACGIYGRRRPEICGAFFCKLAKKLDRGGTTLSEAKAEVDRAFRLLADIEPLMEPGENIVAARKRWYASKPADLTDPRKVRFHMQMAALNIVFDRHFRSGSNMVIRPDSENPGEDASP